MRLTVTEPANPGRSVHRRHLTSGFNIKIDPESNLQTDHSRQQCIVEAPSFYDQKVPCPIIMLRRNQSRGCSAVIADILPAQPAL